jgi:folate-binding protein YgfZ
MPIVLPAPQVIQISGADAVAFAQAQFSSDLHALQDGHWQWSAWLSAQGRVRAFFHLLRINPNDLRLVLRGGSAAQMCDALARYVFRAKVHVRVVDDASAFLLDRPLDADKTVTEANRSQVVVGAFGMSIALPGDSPRWLLLSETRESAVATEDSESALNSNALADIDAGLVTLAPATEDRLLPDWIGLTDLAATSVRKGCYPGQEIVARLHFKGGNKRWLHHLTFDAAELPSAGASIGTGDSTDDGRGTILNAAWISPGVGAALAVLAHTDGQSTDRMNANGFTLRMLKRIYPLPPNA